MVRTVVAACLLMAIAAADVGDEFESRVAQVIFNTSKLERLRQEPDTDTVQRWRDTKDNGEVVYTYRTPGPLEDHGAAGDKGAGVQDHVDLRPENLTLRIEGRAQLDTGRVAFRGVEHVFVPVEHDLYRRSCFHRRDRGGGSDDVGIVLLSSKTASGVFLNDPYPIVFETESVSESLLEIEGALSGNEH